MCIAFPNPGHQPPPPPPSRLDRLLSRLPEGVQMAVGGVVLMISLLPTLLLFPIRRRRRG